MEELVEATKIHNEESSKPKQEEPIEEIEK
jgi:hypothetical protein